MSRLSASSWIGLNCGDMVRERDGRHVGRVEAVDWGHTAKVRWTENRFLSFVPVRDLVVVERVERRGVRWDAAAGRHVRSD